ncbi:MAG TPA: hypothetical protein VGJ21_25195 [Terracidiphilus sp.]|jgi:hypothetical protein
MASDRDAERQLESFIAKYSPEIAACAREARARIRAKYPTSFELVYDNYNALAIGYAPSEKTSEAIFSIALYPRWVSLFFLQAAGLPDPERILKGSGKVVKHVVLPSPDALDHPAVRDLMREAEVLAKAPFSRTGTNRLLIRSVSQAQRARRPVASKRVRVAESASTRKKGTKR